MNEARLIIGCKQQDRKAQKKLFDKFAYAMLLLCMRYVQNKSDAEEMMLNGFYKFFKNIERFEYAGDGSTTPWLKKIMVNECLMFLRKNADLDIYDEEQAAEVAANDEVISRLTANEIFALVQLLPPGYRTVFNLYVVEGLSHKEIAGLLEITEGTSKSQLNRARLMLQKEMHKAGIVYEKRG